MGVLRIGGGIAGIIDYLVNGRKQGQMMTRDELDERVVLHGDLDVTGLVIESMNVAGQKYLHLSFSVKERDLPIERFREIDAFIREKITAAYQADELNVYSELQRPKIKNVLNKTTGEWHERLDHIHYVIPQKNLITGKKENPVGYFDHNVEFFEAIQELANIKFGLASPKDNARVNISHADVVARVKEVDTFKKGAFKDLKGELINDILAKDIKDYDSFKEHLKGIGTVKITKPGKDDEYLGVKPFGKPKFINLREPEFRREFFELPEAERAQILGAGHDEKPSSRMRPKRTEAEYEASVQDWVNRRSKEVRYLNSGSKVYKKYFAATKEEKAEILAYYEQRAQAQRNKTEKQHDEQYRKQGRSNGTRRAGMERDAGERIFAERAEQRAFARAMGNDSEPGLAVPTFGQAPRFGDRVLGLSQGDVDGQRRSAALLVQADAHHDVHPRQPGDADHAMQRAGGSGEGSDGIINPATGRTSDSVTGQLLRDEREKQRQEAGDRQPTIQDIKKGLDAHRLLADLSVTHKLLPSDYLVSPAADGSARISHKDKPTSHFNVSDFLTKHMHMAWPEAQRYLVGAYDRQRDGEPEPTVAAPARPDMYAAFMVEYKARNLDAIAKREQAEHKEAYWAEKRDANDKFKKGKARIRANKSLTPEERGVAIKRLEKAKADADKDRDEQYDKEEAEAKFMRLPQQQYRLWLQAKAQAGDHDALAELRAQRTEPHRKASVQDRIISAGDNTPDAGKLLAKTESDRRQLLQYTVARNGDVTYYRQNREVLIDAGRKVVMIELSEDAIEQGLRLASIKWGGKMQLTGDDSFIRQAIGIAARKKLHIEFKDPEQNAAFQEEKEKVFKGLEYLKKEIQRVKEIDEAASAKMKEEIAARKATAKPTPAVPAQEQPATPAAPVEPAQQPVPAEQAPQYQVIYAQEPEQDDEQDDDLERDRKIKPP